MQIINEIKNRTYKKNLFATDFVVRSAYARNNLGVERKVKEFSEIDSLLDVEELKEKVKSFESHKKMYGVNCIGSESLLYGHINSLYEYAGLSMNKPTILPKIEHGVNFSESIVSESAILNHPNMVYQGAYKKEMIHSVNPLKPVFCIGPYIHYASPYYSGDVVNRIKRKNGKTLLVFPTHSYEASSMEYDLIEFVDNVMDVHAKSFDTVMVSGYWLNLNSPIYHLFESRGAKIVSAGARFDLNFLKRLKTMISLADKVVGNDIGTHIGYSLQLGKPFEILQSNIVKKDSSGFTVYEKANVARNSQLFNEAFGSGGKSDEIIQTDLFKKFWGGPELVKSRTEMQNLIFLAQKHLAISKGNIGRYDDSIMQLYKELRSAKSKDEAMQYQLLQQALLNNH